MLSRFVYVNVRQRKRPDNAGTMFFLRTEIQICSDFDSLLQSPINRALGAGGLRCSLCPGGKTR